MVKGIDIGKTIEGGYDKLFEELLKTTENGKVQICFNNKVYKTNDKTKISKDIHKAVVYLLYQCLTDSDNKIGAKDYLLDRIAGAKIKNRIGLKLNEVEAAYLTLAKVRNEMVAYSKKVGGKLTQDFITDERLKQMLELTVKLVKEDKFIKSQVFAFVRLDGNNYTQAKTYLQSGTISKEFKEAYKKTFFNALSNTFFTFKSNSKGGKKHAGKGIKQVSADRPLPKVSIFTKTFPK